MLPWVFLELSQFQIYSQARCLLAVVPQVPSFPQQGVEPDALGSEGRQH